ncbi:MAG: TlpA disulfide reductase family protein [Isosphaeraceae bacterium]
MLPSRPVETLGALLTLAACLASPGQAPAQVAQPAAPAGGESVQAINDDYDRRLLQLDRDRLTRLARLAASQKPAEAAATYEQLFRLGIAANLFRDVEAPADAVVKGGSPSPTTLTLAHLCRIVARADRGAFDESLEALNQALALREAAAGKPALSASELVGICDTYYQRLIHVGQYEVAAKAFRLASGQVENPALKEYLSSRLARLEQVGKPSPALRGTDIDGKPFDLASLKSKTVLVIFWASWCLPNAAELTWLEQVYADYKAKGFEVVGVDVDALGTRQSLEAILPSVRRFLIDHNVPWRNLVSGPGEQDYARAFGVTDIPANVLVDRDGKVVQLDVVQKNLEPVLSKLFAQ